MTASMHLTTKIMFDGVNNELVKFSEASFRRFTSHCARSYQSEITEEMIIDNTLHMFFHTLMRAPEVVFSCVKDSCGDDDIEYKMCLSALCGLARAFVYSVSTECEN